MASGMIIPSLRTDGTWTDISTTSGECNYKIVNNVVYLRLDMLDNSEGLIHIGTLPSGLIPSKDIMLCAYYDMYNGANRYRTYYVDHNTGNIYGKSNMAGSYSTITSYPT